MTAAPFVPVDIASADFKRTRHQEYARWRAMSAFRVKLKGPARGADEALIVTRYVNVSDLLRNPLLVKDAANAGLSMRAPPALFRPLMRNMLAQDDPDHARLKRLVQLAFTPRRVAMLEERTQAISLDLIARLRPRGSFDLIREYALPLPVAVISEMLGVPDKDRQRFARWSGAVIRAGSSAGAMLFAIPEIIAFVRYLRKLIALKKDKPSEDLISALVRAHVGGESLDAEELMGMIAILLSAGHETTTNLIGNGMLVLLDTPEMAGALRSGAIPAGPAVEELLRFAGPVEVTTPRYASVDTTIAGIDTPRGTLVLGLVGSANHDDRHFTDADRLDLERTPNRHLSFGEGGHYCVGAALARMEGAVAFRDLLRHFPNMRLAVSKDDLRWRPGLVLTGLQSLPVAI